MITDDTKIVTIKESKGWVTNIDESDLSEDFFSRVRGGRHSTSSLIFQRDNGTKHRYAAATYPVSNLSPTTVTLFDSYTIQDPIDNVEYEIIVGLDNAGSLHVWAYDGSAFTEITRIFTADITGSVTDAAGAVIGLTTIKENGVSAALPTGSFPANMEGWVVVNTTPVGSALAGSSGIVTSSGSNDASHVVLAGINPGASGMKWAAGDHLTLYRTGGLYNATFGGTQGSTPHIAWSPNDTQRKVTLLYGNSATPTVAQIPLIIMRRPQRKYLLTGTTPAYSLPASAATSWFTESGGGLCSYEAIFGSKKNVKLSTGTYDSKTATAPDTTNYPANAWLNITAQNTTADGTGSGGTVHWNTYSFIYITIGYDNYEESDPVFKFHHGVGDSGGYQSITLKFYINPALMPKNATQIRVYRYEVSLLTTLDVTAIQAFLGAIGDDQLFLDKTINLQDVIVNAGGGKIGGTGGGPAIPGSDTQLTLSTLTTDTYGRWLTIQYISPLQQPETSDSIESNLAHAVMDHRAIIKPRFAARATKSTGAVVVTDSDDSTLLVSSYNGAGTNEER